MHSTIPRRSFLGLLLATPTALTAVPNVWIHPARFSVGMCGWNGGLSELLTEVLRLAFRREMEITTMEEDFVEPFLARVGSIGRPDFDLLIAFFNPHLYATRDWSPPPSQADLKLLTRLRTQCGRPPLVIHNGWAGYTSEQFRQAGAGAVLPMPFSLPEFSTALAACLAHPSGTEAVAPDRETTPFLMQLPKISA